MEQTTCCPADIESIMQRLRGKDTPYTQPKITPIPSSTSPSEIGELKTIVKTLGAKLKDSYKEISDNKATLLCLEQSKQALIQNVEQLQASLTAKDHDLTNKKNEEHQATLTIEQLKRDLVELRTRNATPTTSPDLALLREELLAVRSEQLGWQEERKRLETALDQERQKGRSETSNNNGQLVRLAMSCKQLEEEVHSLKCERAATIRQFNQLKEINEESQKGLASEKEKIQEKEESLAASTRTIQELIDTIEKHKTTIATLITEKEIAAQKETALLTQIAIDNASLAQEKASNEGLCSSLKAANDSFHSLTLQLDQERRTFHETVDKCTLFQKEKEAADTRVKEVEELLIVKLQMISELEEQLGEALTHCDDVEHRAVASEQNAISLAEDLQKTAEARDTLHEKGLKLEQQLGRITTENAELKKRTEAFERIKKSIAEASSHAHAILRTLDPGAKPALSISTPVDDLGINSKEQGRTLFEERFEQHELF